MSVSPAGSEVYGESPADHLVLALHKSRITRALHAMRDCRDRLDIHGALDAEKNLNDDLDLLGRLLHRRCVGARLGRA